jgi:hypothetical protein
LRAKDFSTTLETRLEEVRAMAQKDVSTLEKELEQLQKAQARQLRDLAMLREERDSALQRASASKLEADTLDVRLNAQTVEYEGLAQELQTLRRRLQDTDDQLLRAQQQFQDYRCSVGNKESETLASITEQLVEAQTSHLQELANIKKSHKEDLARAMEEHDRTSEHRIQELCDRHNTDMMRIQKELADQTSALEIARCGGVGNKNKLTEELEEERVESAALRLRLKAYEDQAMKQKQETKLLQQQLQQLKMEYGPVSHYFTGGGRPPAATTDDTSAATQVAGSGGVLGTGTGTRSSHDSSRLLGDADGAPGGYVSSPMFSEDMGSVFPSLPSSPMLSMRASGPSEFFALHSGGNGGEGVMERGPFRDSGNNGVFDSAEFLESQRRRQKDNEANSTRGGGGGSRKNLDQEQLYMHDLDYGEASSNKQQQRGGGGGGGAENNRHIATVLDENERLKRIVKEVSFCIPYNL